MSTCVVLVPIYGPVKSDTEFGLRQLELAGYEVRRLYDYAAVDQARNRLATDALQAGFDELMWIDADMGFHLEDVERLRQHNVPIVGAISAKKGPRGFACNFLPGTMQVQFGRSGGLIEVEHLGFGFVLSRRLAAC